MDILTLIKDIPALNLAFGAVLIGLAWATYALLFRPLNRIRVLYWSSDTSTYLMLTVNSIFSPKRILVI